MKVLTPTFQAVREHAINKSNGKTFLCASGNLMNIKSVHVDCNGNAIIRA